MDAHVSIGEAARRSGVKAPTIRYYESIGLMPVPARTAANRRHFDVTDLRRLTFIRHARELGFDVLAIRALLALQDNPSQSCAAADEIASVRLSEVERRIYSLQALRAELGRMVGECTQGRVAECKVIETLAGPAHEHGRLS